MQLVSQQDFETFKSDLLALLQNKDEDVKSLRIELEALRASNTELRDELHVVKDSNTTLAHELSEMRTAIAAQASSGVNQTDNVVERHQAALDDIQASITPHSLTRVGRAVGNPYGGTLFNDFGTTLAHAVPKITFIAIRPFYHRIGGVSYRLLYPDGWRTKTVHGKQDADRKLELHDGEYITKLVIGTGRTPWDGNAKSIQYLNCITNMGRGLEGGKRAGRDCVDVSAPENEEGKGKWGLVGFLGRSWDEIDCLSPIWGAVY
ncbi:hypothetical protein CYLTODRAFT_492712 [Cylindrobasidium torrendii FP15055 ss-10]|uniref:Jacalin-type lectin domain-containing protein n=1 Tax=Cylindrobasidium torrendii FP15055 ss-10 TaxID=1314674 RepID=A0A0D7B621_9AGAR|nr:hypothetical protein CYLTODRAFT_492712 [Cylindrobasidium torrendii FP15055 ss-10]